MDNLYVEIKDLEKNISKSEQTISKIKNETSWTVATFKNSLGDLMTENDVDTIKRQLFQLLSELSFFHKTVNTLSEKLKTCFIEPKQSNDGISQAISSYSSNETDFLSLSRPKKRTKLKKKQTILETDGLEESKKSDNVSPRKLNVQTVRAEEQNENVSTSSKTCLDKTVELKLNRLSVEEIQKWISNNSQNLSNNLHFNSSTNSALLVESSEQKQNIEPIRTRPKRVLTKKAEQFSYIVTNNEDDDFDIDNHAETKNFFASDNESDPEFQANNISEPSQSESEVETEPTTISSKNPEVNVTITTEPIELSNQPVNSLSLSKPVDLKNSSDIDTSKNLEKSRAEVQNFNTSEHLETNKTGALHLNTFKNLDKNQPDALHVNISKNLETNEPDFEERPPTPIEVDIEAHLKQISSDEGYQCPYCKSSTKYTGTRKIYLSSHIKNKHPNERITEEILRKAFNPFKCRICEAKLSSIQRLTFHLQSHSSKKDYLCSECGAAFKSIVYLRQHNRQIHLKVKNYACPICPERFIGNDHRVLHVKKKHPDSSTKYHEVSNKQRNKETNQPDALHVNTSKILETNEPDFEERPPTPIEVDIEAHLKQISSDEGYQCPYCKSSTKYTGTRKIYLSSHIKNKHPNERITEEILRKAFNPFKCRICEAKLSSIQRLTFHLQSHSSVLVSFEKQSKKTYKKKGRSYRTRVKGFQNQNVQTSLSDSDADEVIIKEEELDISDYEFDGSNEFDERNQMEIGTETEPQLNTLTPVDDAPSSWFQLYLVPQ